MKQLFAVSKVVTEESDAGTSTWVHFMGYARSEGNRPGVVLAWHGEKPPRLYVTGDLVTLDINPTSDVPDLPGEG